MACCSLNSAAVELPDMGDPSSNYLSPEQELRLGQSLYRELRQNLAVIDDPQINDYIQGLGYRLVAESDNQTLRYTFFVVNDPAINAFAAPGGFIGVHSGLILATQSESELAAVLAHETAHVTQKHLARALEKTSKMSLPATVALLAAILLANHSSQASSAAMAGAIAGSEQFRLDFTRSQEQEADRLGMQLLARAGLDPRSMADFFGRLQQANRYNETALPELLRTHPVTTSRIADAQGRADLLSPVRRPDSDGYRLTRAKLRVLAAPDASTALAYFSEKTRPVNNEDYAYGHALALQKLGRLKDAEMAFNALLKKSPDKTPYLTAWAEVKIALGQAAQAVPPLADALTLAPHNHPLTLAYANALIEADRAVDARRVLRNHTLQRERAAPETYRLLARAENTAGHPADGHQAMAEYYYLQGQTTAAIEQIEMGLKALDKDDAYRHARLSARRDQLKALWALERPHAEK